MENIVNFWNSTVTTNGSTILVGVITGIITGVSSAVIVMLLNSKGEKNKLKEKRKLFFLEKCYDNVYFLNIGNLGNDIQENNKVIPIPIQSFNYSVSLKVYKELTLLLSYLFEVPINDVEYLEFVKKSDSGYFKYKLNHKKYEKVMSNLKKYNMPTKEFDLDKELFYKDIES